MEEEKIIWQGSSSQWSKFGTYLLCGLTFWLIFPVVIAIWQFLNIKFKKYKVTDQRIIVRKGILSKSTNELELFRVKDLRLEEPFFLRMFDLSNLILVTSDKTHQKKIIPAVPQGRNLKEKLRHAVEKRRDIKRVREIDF